MRQKCSDNTKYAKKNIRLKQLLGDMSVHIRDIVYTLTYAFPRGKAYALEEYNDYGREILLHQRVLAHRHTITEICKQFDISRPLGYKYIERDKQMGFKVLE